MRFKTLLLISLVILALSLAWTSLNHPQKQPYKTETMISLLVSIILEIYFFMVIDVLALTLQESNTRVLPSPSWRLWGEFKSFVMPMFLLLKFEGIKNIIYDSVNISWHFFHLRKWLKINNCFVWQPFSFCYLLILPHLISINDKRALGDHH